ncbi:amidase [Natrarchaeobaculum aegyptiacum]|uniref:Amidase n=1 Tax=Natrarchaeobaculum aegyptiacum TaxID=745377 RepID=A0A2Z2HY89_9EURY|nr:amidase [Natrarchaeobaculum aegyptiacum]ARS88468.1 amidase [Natrarchaeobaculum aegyptiacum]
MTADSTLTAASATELARRIRDGEVTATDAVEAHLERIETVDGEINAFVTVCADEARDAAAEADRALDGVETDEDLGPLHGVPVALKDLGGLKEGVRHTNGSALFADNVADRTALLVERLEDAGAIVIGKTNTPAFGHKGTTDNGVIGPTASPVDTDLNAGGSSGGSAAALGARMTPIATGSDAGGSIRIPAALCGVYGLKPTFGLVPDDSRPSAFGRSTHHVTKGPMTRTVADAALMLSVLAGPDASDPRSVPVEVDPLEALERPVDGWSIAYSPALEAFDVAEEVQSVVDEAVTAFEAAGATVDEVTLDHGYSMSELEAAVLPTYTTSILETATLLEEEHGIDLREHPDEVPDSLLAMVEAGERFGAADIARSGVVRTDFYDSVESVLAEYDLLVTPTLSYADIALEDDPRVSDWNWTLTWPFNWTGHPVASVPAGVTDRGHPVGLQVLGRRFDDEAVIAASAALERERPWDWLYEDAD